MSKAFNDPNLLTKDRLKRELESNGVTLPRVDQKKDFYVKLYRENLSPQAREHSSLNGGFSSDDDGDFELSMQEKVFFGTRKHFLYFLQSLSRMQCVNKLLQN